MDISVMRRRSRPSLVLALVSMALHLLGNGHYGFFRDELYFIVCGQHPDWGYVDQPPLVPLLAAGSHAVFGDWLLGFRLLPALVASAVVGLTAEFARLTGGGRFAQWLTGLCVLFAPGILIQGVLLTTDLFQALTWLGLAWVLVRLEQSKDERWWIAFGAITGFSLNAKYLIAFFLVALAIGLLATPQRRSLLRPWLWLGALLAGVMVLPNVLWQQAHGWPFIELGQAGSGGKNVAMPLPTFFLEQLWQTGPVAGLVWLIGLGASAVRPQPRVARAFPIAWALLLVVFVSQHGKPYYLTPIYPILLALGAVRIELWLSNRIGRGAALALTAGVGLVTAPMTLPILPVETFIRYQAALGTRHAAEEHQKQGALPQYYADMFGWRNMAEQVAKVYAALPPEERAHAVFWGNNYGEAAAIDVFGRPLGLPPALSGHNQYFLWGPRGADGSVIIIVGGDTDHYAQLFRSYTVAGHIDASYAMPYETDLPIYVLRGMKMPLAKFWPTVKSYN